VAGRSRLNISNDLERAARQCTGRGRYLSRFFRLCRACLRPSVRTTTGIYLQSTFGDVLDSKGATLRTERKHKQRFQTQQNARNHQATQTNNTYSSKHKTVYKQKNVNRNPPIPGRDKITPISLKLHRTELPPPAPDFNVDNEFWSAPERD
jgi:hypothetical protein